MSNNDQQWLTAGEAARILHMSERQVNRYGSGPDARLRTNRAGRRVLYLASDVHDLANELRVDIRPAPQRSTAMMSPDLVRYLQEQAEQLRQSGETQASIDRRLAEIERRLSEPQPTPQAKIPMWLTVLIVLLVVLVIIGIGLQIAR